MALPAHATLCTCVCVHMCTSVCVCVCGRAPFWFLLSSSVLLQVGEYRSITAIKLRERIRRQPQPLTSDYNPGWKYINMSGRMVLCFYGYTPFQINRRNFYDSMSSATPINTVEESKVSVCSQTQRGWTCRGLSCSQTRPTIVGSPWQVSQGSSSVIATPSFITAIIRCTFNKPWSQIGILSYTPINNEWRGELCLWLYKWWMSNKSFETITVCLR